MSLTNSQPSALYVWPGGVRINAQREDASLPVIATAAQRVGRLPAKFAGKQVHQRERMGPGSCRSRGSPGMTVPRSVLGRLAEAARHDEVELAHIGRDEGGAEHRFRIRSGGVAQQL